MAVTDCSSSAVGRLWDFSLGTISWAERRISSCRAVVVCIMSSTFAGRRPPTPNIVVVGRLAQAGAAGLGLRVFILDLTALQRCLGHALAQAILVVRQCLGHGLDQLPIRHAASAGAAAALDDIILGPLIAGLALRTGAADRAIRDGARRPSELR
jgi:hypothetical protein